MFFRKKNRDEGVKLAEESKDAQPVEGTAPDVVETPEAADEAKLSDETVEAAVVKADADAPAEASVPTAVLADEEAVRLFPGFEHDDFEVGFRADREHPCLMLRWKDGDQGWFVVPALFNRSILTAMDERESSNDLNRLLRNYGYDIEAVQE